MFRSEKDIIITSDRSTITRSDERILVDASDNLEVSADGDFSQAISGNIYANAGKIIRFSAGKSSLTLKDSGEVIIIGTSIALSGSERIELRAQRLKAQFKQVINLISKKN